MFSKENKMFWILVSRNFSVTFHHRVCTSPPPTITASDLPCRGQLFNPTGEVVCRITGKSHGGGVIRITSYPEGRSSLKLNNMTITGFLLP